MNNFLMLSKSIIIISNAKISTLSDASNIEKAEALEKVQERIIVRIPKGSNKKVGKTNLKSSQINIFTSWTSTDGRLVVPREAKIAYNRCIHQEAVLEFASYTPSQINADQMLRIERHVKPLVFCLTQELFGNQQVGCRQ